MAGMKGKQTVRDMVLSMGVIVLVAFFIYLFIPHDGSQTPVKRVDYRVELLTARRAAAYPVAAPEGLPKEWRPTSVRYQGTDHDAWHLGFHTADGLGQYVAVEQSTEKPSEFIEQKTQGAGKTKVTQRIGDQTWQRYEGPKYDALVFEGDGYTTVVTGSGSFGQLTKMASALKTS
ncbi:DUF4245 domain-containing protein [Streptomyces sp. NPDC002577]